MSTYTEAEIQAREAVAELYIGLFGRATDPEGLDYWVNELVTGNLTEEEVRANFVNDQPEWEEGLGALTNEQLVYEMYGYLFEREPDEAGYAYWVNELDTGSVNADQLVFALINGAGLDDRRVLDYKVEASLYFSDNFLETGDEWVPESGRQAATAAVDGVDDRASADASKASTDAGGETAAATFTLQVGIDEVEGTQGGDLIRGQAGDADGWTPTLDAFDTINGGLGFDRLELAVRGQVTELPTFATIENVESLSIGLGSAASLGSGSGYLDLTGIIGAESLIITGDASGDVKVESAVSGEVSIGEFTTGRGIGGDVDISDASATSFSVLGDADVVVTAGDAESITVDAGAAAQVYAGDDVGSINIVAGEDAYSGAGDVTSIDISAGGNATVEAGNVTSLNVDAFAVNVDVSDATSITIEAGEDAYVDAGAVTSIDVTSEAYSQIDAGDVSSIVVSAGANVLVDARNVDSLDATAEGSVDAILNAAGSIIVDAGGAVDIDVDESITSVDVTSGSSVTVDAENGSIGSVLFDASSSVSVAAASDGATVGDLAGTAAQLAVFGSDGVGNVDITITSASGEDDIDVYSSYGSVGNVVIDATSDSLGSGQLDIYVGGSDGVGSISVDLGGNTNDIDIFVETATADPVSIQVDSAVSDEDSALSLSLESFSSTSLDYSSGPSGVILDLNGATSDGQYLNVDFEGQSGKYTYLESISVTGNSNISLDASYDALIPTLTTIDAGEATGNNLVYFGVGKSDADTALDVSVTTGSGDDYVQMYAVDATGSDQMHGDVTIATGAGDDEVFSNNEAYVGAISVDLGTGDDDLYLMASDASISVIGGEGDDVIEVGSRNINSGSEWVGEIVLDIDAGAGDDTVKVSTVNASLNDSAIDLGEGDNTLHYQFAAPGAATSVLSDSDIEDFDVTMDGNVTGDLHTLILETNVDISDDVTLDISGLGDVSVLKMGETELEGDRIGQTLTIDGGAASFTIDVSEFSSDHDLGESTSATEELDNQILAIATPGVEALSIVGSDEIGVLLNAEDNTSLTSLNVTGDNDTIDVALVGFTSGTGIDVTVTAEENGADADVFVFGGAYGDINVDITSGEDDSGNDADAAVVVEAFNTDAAIDLGDYATTIDSVTISSLDTDGFAEGAAILHLDGHSVSDGVMGVGTVGVAAVSLTGDLDSSVHVDDFSDGSTVTVGNIDINMVVSDESDSAGGITLAGNAGAAITLGNIDIDVTAGEDVGADDYNWTNALWVTDDEGSTITAGNINFDWANESDATAATNDGNEVWVGGVVLSGTSVVIGDVDLNAAGQDAFVTFCDSENTTLTLGNVDASAASAFVEVSGQVATSDGNDVNIVMGDVTLQDTDNDYSITGANIGSFLSDGPSPFGFPYEAGSALVIANNIDDYSAGILSVEVGNVSMSGSDSAAVAIVGNQGETELFNRVLVPQVGVQVDLGTVHIDVNDVALLMVSDNDGAHVVMGDVAIDLGAMSDGGYSPEIGQAFNLIEGNSESVISIGNTDITIGGGSDAGYLGAFGVSVLNVAGNTDSEITFGDYNVTVGSDGGYIGLGYNSLSVVDNTDSEITFGNVSVLTTAANFSDEFGGVAYGASVLELAGNSDTDITFGDVSLVIDAYSDAGLAEIDIYSNLGATITLGEVTLEGSFAGVRIDGNSDTSVTMGQVSLASEAGGLLIADNTDSVIDIGAVTQIGDGSDSFGYGSGVDLVIEYNGSDTDIDIVSFSSTLTYTDGEVSMTDNDYVDITIGDVLMSDVTYFDLVMTDNDNSTITLGNVTIHASEFVDVLVTDNDNSTITLGNVTINADASDSVDFYITDNDNSTITVGDTIINGDAIDFAITDNNDATITLGAVTLSGSVVTLDITDNLDSTVTLGHIDVTADSAFDLDVTGSTTDEVVTLGNISVDLSDAGSTVDIYLDTVRGASEIDVDLSGSNMGNITIDIDTDDFFKTTLSAIDLSDADGSGNTILIDLGGANLSDDVTITFGDFGSAEVYTNIDDDVDIIDQDGDGVRQTYVFEGSDIGDITINGFVAGLGAARDVELSGVTDGVLLATDRLDLSAFEGASVDDLTFDFNDVSDAVIITSDLFDGRIIVTGAGVDNNVDDADQIIDRVADSIIFG